MIKHQFSFEWMIVRREKLFAIVAIVFLILAFFSVRSGREKVAIRQSVIATAKAEVAEFDRRASTSIDSLVAGLKKAPEPWLDPRSLSVYGQRGARVVSMDASPMAIIATGQSDLYTHVVRPRLSAESHTLSFSELSNPVQLMFGSFDLAFVIVYLLPLMVLAFSYNILSGEKEQGIFRLTGSQPISIYRWLVVKVLFRFLLLAGVVVFSILLALLSNGLAITTVAAAVVKLLLIVIGYMLFWFAVSVIVNLHGKASGLNAAMVVGVWVVVVLMIPSVISQFVNTFYPVPSRVNMIHEFRVAQAESSRKTDQILRGYLNEHPELAPRDSTSSNQYSWWLGYFASADIVNNAVAPVVEGCNIAIARQQDLVNTLRFISPAVLTQDALNDLSGTSTAHYGDFRRQVVGFSGKWKSYFLPRMFRNEIVSPADLAQLPSYTYSDDAVPDVWWEDFIGVIFFGIAVFMLSFWRYQRSVTEQLMVY